MKMKSFDPSELGIRDRHRLMTGAVNPRPIAWASTVDAEGNRNLAPYSFFNMFSANPPILIFSSNRRGRDNTTKDTLHNIEVTREVVINVVPYALVHQMNISSSDYASDIDEFEKAGVTPLASETVAPFRVAESPVQFECEVIDIIYLGEEGGAGNLFLCEVKHMHFNEAILGEDGLVDPQAIQLVGRLGKNHYAKAFNEAVFEIDNPFEKINLGFDGLPTFITKSKYLTGNEIASLAMETELPQNHAVAQIREEQDFAGMSENDVNHEVKNLIKEGKTNQALTLLFAYYKL